MIFPPSKEGAVKSGANSPTLIGSSYCLNRSAMFLPTLLILILLLNELNTKKRDIELKTGKKIRVAAVSARNINKKRKFKVNKKIFYKNPLEIFKKKNI